MTLLQRKKHESKAQRENKAVSGHTSGKDLLLPMALVATSSKHSRAFLSGCFSAHIYLPAQNAAKNQSNVYVCVHTSVKWSNNNSVKAAVVSTFFFCYCINIFSFTTNDIDWIVQYFQHQRTLMILNDWWTIVLCFWSLCWCNCLGVCPLIKGTAWVQHLWFDPKKIVQIHPTV